MKICIVSMSRPDKAIRGNERIAWCHSRELAKLGCNVHIFYPSELKIEESVGKIWFHGVSIKKSSAFLRRISFFKKCYNEIVRNHLIIGFDVITFYGPITIPMMPLLRNLERPLILHDPVAAISEMQAYRTEIIQTFPSSLSIIGHFLEVILYEIVFMDFADYIFVGLPASVKSFKYYRPNLIMNKFRVIPYGQDIYDEFHHKIIKKVGLFKKEFDNRKIILFIGGTNWLRKGAKSILFAFREVLKQIPSILIIVGTAQEPYISLMKKLNLVIGKDVIVTGIVSDEYLALLYASCDLFTLPSNHEAFSQTVIEAMAFGKPIIASPIASYPMKDRVEGYVVVPSDKKLYSEAIVKVLSNRKITELMSKRSIEKANMYSWKTSTKHLYDSYLEILND